MRLTKTNMRNKEDYVSPETEVYTIAIESKVLGISGDDEDPQEPIGGGDNPDVDW